MNSKTTDINSAADPSYPAGFGSIPAILHGRRRILLVLCLAIAGLVYMAYRFLPRHAQAIALIGEGSAETGKPGGQTDSMPRNLDPLSLAHLAATKGTLHALEQELGEQGTQLLESASLDTFVTPGVRLVQIECNHPKRWAAALIANTLCKVLIARNREFLRNQAQEALALDGERLVPLRERLNDLGRRMARLRKDHNLDLLDQRVQAALHESASIRRRLATLAGQRRFLLDSARRSHENEAAQAARSIPKPPGPNELALERSLRQRALLLLTLKPRHPKVLVLDRKIARLQEICARTKGEPQPTPARGLHSSPTSPQSTAAAVSKLDTQIAALKTLQATWDARNEDLAAAGTQLRSLESERGKTAADLAGIEKRIARLRLVAKTPPGLYRMVENARAPKELMPMIPWPVAVLFGAFVCLLGVFTVVMRDLVQRNVYTPRDAEGLIGVPVYAEFSAGLKIQDLYDALVQQVLTHCPDLGVLGVACPESEDAAGCVRTRLLAAFSRLGYEPQNIRFEELREHPWTVASERGLALVQLPNKGTGPSAEAAAAADAIILVVRAGHFAARDFSLWSQGCSGGVAKLAACVLTSPTMPAVSSDTSCSPKESTGSKACAKVRIGR